MQSVGRAPSLPRASIQHPAQTDRAEHAPNEDYQRQFNGAVAIGLFSQPLQLGLNTCNRRALRGRLTLELRKINLESLQPLNHCDFDFDLLAHRFRQTIKRFAEFDCTRTWRNRRAAGPDNQSPLSLGRDGRRLCHSRRTTPRRRIRRARLTRSRMDRTLNRQIVGQVQFRTRHQALIKCTCLAGEHLRISLGDTFDETDAIA